MKTLHAHDFSPAPQVCPPEGAGLVDINELSRRLSIPKGTLYNLVYLRRIPFVKRGRSLRFDPAEVLRSLPRFGMIGSAGKG